MLLSRAYVDMGSGTCTHPSHIIPIPMIGYVMSASPVIYTDKFPQIEMTHIMIGNCGHIGVLVGGSGTGYGDISSLIRLSDSFVGTFSGVMALGSPVSDCGG